MGALASGAAAAMGTGAFSAALIDDRDIDIEVVGDDAALMQLIPGYDEVTDSTVSEDRVFIDDDGKLAISFNDSNSPGGQGINPSSTYQVGAIGDRLLEGTVKDKAEQSDLITSWEDVVLYGPSDPALSNPSLEATSTPDDPAFVLRNETDTQYKFIMSYEGDAQSDSDVIVVGQRGGSGSGDDAFLFSASGLHPSAGATAARNIFAGNKYSFSLLAITGSDAKGDHFDGTLRIEITESSL